MTRQYFWLYGKPEYWNIKGFKVGEEQHFTIYNDSNNRRRIFRCFLDAKFGDYVIGYQSAPIVNAK